MTWVIVGVCLWVLCGLWNLWYATARGYKYAQRVNISLLELIVTFLIGPFGLGIYVISWLDSIYIALGRGK